MRVGLVGYGVGGRQFHAPFLEAATDIEIAGVVARSETTTAAVREDFPQVPIFPSLTTMLEAGVDAVTITTPPATRRDLVMEAIAAGVHVVADKPFAPSAAVAREMAEAARAAGVQLSVFHNRRFDADLRTLRGVLDSGALGELWRVHSRFDLDQPELLEAGEHGGLLRDLGTHLVDQMMWLLGPVRAVSARLDHVELAEGRTDAAFALTLQHADGVTSCTSSTKLNHLHERTLRAYGSAGSYTATSTDVQAEAIAAGKRPVQDPENWGYEAPERWGTLHTAEGHEPVPSAQGSYTAFYEQFAAACAGRGAAPSPASEGIAVLEVLDAARRSDENGGAFIPLA
ncbi:Gfo/Idh/MocA family oxidoreductase [Brachybacterium saurashtrense]|uniref:Gfo/Idh/MocA family oxidoreductase n=1 Tax=Brachybacterium saurashtrense TaxID=556288 RepID=A0A345YTD7_9MICO|nr:Gfo/Idh/MocA family oxidoreductase [Brachybacterium saurashtrense]AXK47189.1 gfo/Idh/MocA family oxidoreductase [Brachybacterium saurashtrense]RRR21973.1 gfo/Idh/MocA family oxidoreductase [Brachybacterium saurashtrense]